MARQKTVIVNDVEYTLQSVSFTHYTNLTDLYVRPASGRKNTAKYADSLIKSCVIAPTELVREIENFLSERAEPGGSAEKSAT